MTTTIFISFYALSLGRIYNNWFWVRSTQTMRIWLESIRRNNWERDREYFKKLFLFFFSYFFSCVLFSLVLFCWFLLNLRNMHGKAFRKRLLLYCVRMCVFFFKYSSIWNDSCCSFAHLTRNWNETSFLFSFPILFTFSMKPNLCYYFIGWVCVERSCAFVRFTHMKHKSNNNNNDNTNNSNKCSINSMWRIWIQF